MTGDDRTWWKEAVVYQVYPRSFNDSDGDGVGDLRGIVEKVDYLDDLGVDVVWLTPVYDSPQVDNGYDIRDYRSIYSIYGSMDDWEDLRDRLHERDVRLVMDMVLNHTAVDHEWFQRSRREEEPYDDYYHWVEGDPDERPNNWESLFGGPAWKYDEEREAWYLHLFDEAMADLNWSNPAVRKECKDVLRWWVDRGIDGFRLDVINLLSKPDGYPDGDPTAADVGSNHFINGPRIHEYLQELHEEAYSDPRIVTIGETINVRPADANRYTTEDGLNMVFPFEHMYIDAGGSGPWDVADWDLQDLREVTQRWQTGLGEGWIGNYLTNHDQPRIVSRFGDEDYRVESATMLATYLFTLRGTPFVFQGQELGMTNPDFESLDEYRDPATVLRVERALASGSIEAFEEIAGAVNYWSRDNARTPMQWSDDENAGFTTGDPWIKVNSNYETVNAAREREPEDSVFAYYRRLVEFRRDHPAAIYGDYEQVAGDDPSVFAYRRTYADDGKGNASNPGHEPYDLLVVLHFDDEATVLDMDGPDGYDGAEVRLSNYSVEEGAVEVEHSLPELELRPYEARVYGLGEE